RQGLRLGSYSRAVILGRLGRYRDAVADWDLAVSLAPGYIPYRISRAYCLARAGLYDRALSEVVLLARGKTPANGWSFLAAFAALSSAAASADLTRPLPRREWTAERAAWLALAFLGRAHRGGFFRTADNRARLKNDPELNGLRVRADFKAFLDGVLNSEK